MINQCTIVGRLTRDPELTYTPDGVPVAKYQLASQRPYKSQGEKVTDFIACVTWRKDAEFIANNGKKGAMVAVRGRWETRNYRHSQFDITIYVNELNTEEVQLLDWADDQPQGGQGHSRNQGYPDQGGYPPQGGYNSGQGSRRNSNQGNGYNGNRRAEGPPPYQGGYPPNQGGGYGGNPFDDPNYNPFPNGGNGQKQSRYSDGRQIDISDDDLPF